MRITVMGMLVLIGGLCWSPTSRTKYSLVQLQAITKLMSNRIHSTNDWLTASEAARYLKVKPRTLLLWTRQGKVKGFALSGAKRKVWRFRKNDLDAALVESAVLPSKSPSVRPAERMDQ